MEIMRCALAPQYFEETIFSGATYPPPQALERGMVHEIVEPVTLLDRAVAVAKVLAALSPRAFAQTKRQTRAPALARMDDPETDAAIEQIWTAPETLAFIRDYVARTLRKG
jgi:enoyl-CoA hydratase